MTKALTLIALAYAASISTTAIEEYRVRATWGPSNTRFECPSQQVVVKSDWRKALDDVRPARAAGGGGI